MPVKVICKNCGKECLRKPCKAKEFSYCSIKCKNEGMSAKIENQEQMSKEELKKARKALSDKKYYENNADILREKSKLHYAENKDQINSRLKERYENDENFRNAAIRRTRENLEKNRETINARRRELHRLNPQIKREQQKKWREINKNKVKDYAKKSYIKNKKWRLLRMKFYNEKNRDKRRIYIRQYKKLRMQTDLNFYFRETIASCVRSAIKNGGGHKAHRTKELIGCHLNFLLYWIELQFTPEMNWDNYGIVWQIDHIKPASQFDLKQPDQQLECSHFSNLRPFDRQRNQSEGNRRTEDEILQIKLERDNLLKSKNFVW